MNQKEGILLGVGALGLAYLVKKGKLGGAAKAATAKAPGAAGRGAPNSSRPSTTQIATGNGTRTAAQPPTKAGVAVAAGVAKSIVDDLVRIFKPQQAAAQKPAAPGSNPPKPAAPKAPEGGGASSGGATRPGTSPYSQPALYTVDDSTGEWWNNQTGEYYNPTTGDYSNPATGSFYDSATGTYYNADTGESYYGPGDLAPIAQAPLDPALLPGGAMEVDGSWNPGAAPAMGSDAGNDDGIPPVGGDVYTTSDPNDFVGPTESIATPNTSDWQGPINESVATNNDDVSGDYDLAWIDAPYVDDGGNIVGGGELGADNADAGWDA